MFSVIIPSYLESYRNSASQPEVKLHRAIKSVLNQTYQDFELIVVSDGCQKTIDIAKQYECNLFRIDHKGGFGGPARNAGISKASHDFIIYLDSDDCWGVDHLQKIAEEICSTCNFDWYYWNDWIYKNETWIERPVNIRLKGAVGTSNICHKRTLNIKWTESYLHDWIFVRELWHYESKRITTPEYFCCHLPNGLDI